MILRVAFVVALLVIAVFLLGCADARRIDVVSVLKSGNCATSDVGVRLIDYKALAEFRATHLIGMPESPETINKPLHLIAIVPASYPTPGYAISLSEGAELKGPLLTLRVGIQRPAADAILVQMVTHPCLVVGVNDPTVIRVRVVNEAATVIGEVDLPIEQ
jgi:hypothetical protein